MSDFAFQVFVCCSLSDLSSCDLEDCRPRRREVHLYASECICCVIGFDWPEKKWDEVEENG